MRPSSHLQATYYGGACDPHATPRLPPSYPQATLKPGYDFRSAKAQLEHFERLGTVQRNFELAGRELCGRTIVIVVRVEDVVELRHAVFGDEALYGCPIEAVVKCDMAFGRTFVPQVAPIQREPEDMVLAPDQAAQQTVAERDSFVLGLD